MHGACHHYGRNVMTSGTPSDKDGAGGSTRWTAVGESDQNALLTGMQMSKKKFNLRKKIRKLKRIERSRRLRQEDSNLGASWGTGRKD